MDSTDTENQTIAIGSDHAGLELKEKLKHYLETSGLPYKDYGTHSETSTDYPDWGARVARAISNGEYKRGILICGAGIGMSIVANKYPKVRAALCTSEYMAEICRKHNDANIIVFGGRTTTGTIAQRMLKLWIETPFEGGRHAQWVEKLNNLPEK